MIKALLVLISFFILSTIFCSALPQYAMLTGNRCDGCHVNVQGGELRTQFGWYTFHDVSVIDPKWIGLKGFYELLKGNSAFNYRWTFGTDLRWLSWRNIDANSSRQFLQMQYAFYSNIKIFNWLNVYGKYNIAAQGYKNFGQQSYAANVTIQPDPKLPQIKVGWFQPSVGLVYDDHTVLTKQIIQGARRGQYIPPDFSEPGVEINYYALPYLTLTASVNSTNNRNAMHLESSKPSWLGKAVLWDRFLDQKLNCMLGGSAFVNSDFKMFNLFGGVGLTDNVYLLGEFVHSKKPGFLDNDNWFIEVGYKIIDGAILMARAERGKTFDLVDPVGDTWLTQYVLSLKCCPLPFIDIRPDYRIITNNDLNGYTTRWSVNLHVFY